MAKTQRPSDNKTQTMSLDRRKPSDRREKVERRQTSVPVVGERRERVDRRKVSRRRQIDPTTCERDYSQDEIEFMRAMDEYKRANGRMFPTCSEILEVIRALGYQKSVSRVVATSCDSANGRLDSPETPAWPA
ncbi:MAG TPA: hypothetical protein VIY86_14220 [Pirellulaceae bacterium]